MKTVLVLSILVIGLFFLGDQKVCSEDDTIPRLTLIEGKVTIQNHPTLGETPGNNITIIFQKEGCKTCVVATDSDLKGNYKIAVGDGKYKLIVKNPSPVYDLLVPDQKRFIETKKSPTQLINFDIKLKLPEQ